MARNVWHVRTMTDDHWEEHGAYPTLTEAAARVKDLHDNDPEVIETSDETLIWNGEEQRYYRGREEEYSNDWVPCDEENYR